MINKNIELVQRILTQSIEISSSTIIDIFVDYSSHTKGLSVRIMLEGWNEKPKTDLNRTIYIDWPGSEEKLNEVLDYLRKLKEEI
jgi:hypothetical protein